MKVWNVEKRAAPFTFEVEALKGFCVPKAQWAKTRKRVQFGIYWAANEESLQTKKILAKKILCKEKDAKKNIGNKTLILHFFWRKITNIMKKISNLKKFSWYWQFFFKISAKLEIYRQYFLCFLCILSFAKNFLCQNFLCLQRFFVYYPVYCGQSCSLYLQSLAWHSLTMTLVGLI